MSGGAPDSFRRAPRALDDRIAAMIGQSRRPLSAYDIIDLFADQQVKIVPTQIYRCLGRLTESGVVRRIASLRAFCIRESAQEAVVFCEECGAHACLPDEEAFERIAKAALGEGFDDLDIAIEVSGRCRNCRGASKGAGKAPSPRSCGSR